MNINITTTNVNINVMPCLFSKIKCAEFKFDDQNVLLSIIRIYKGEIVHYKCHNFFNGL